MVAALPQGALVLPGFDTAMPQAVWDRLDAALGFEDHPQYRYARLMRDLGLTAAQVAPWTDAPPPAPARNAVLSLALRPAPVTHQWLEEGPSLPPLGAAMAGVTLLEAPAPRDEAIAIALRLRAAAEDGTRAALVSPDRVLTRQVTAALDRWGIVPDDSAGIPAQLTPAGRFLRHVAQLATGPLTAEAALTLLKHPLTHSGDGRGDHLLATRALEMAIRGKGWTYPRPDLIRGFAETAIERGLPGPADWHRWADWVAETLAAPPDPATRPLADRVAAVKALAERIAAGAEGAGSGALWNGNEGRRVHAILQTLADEAPHGTDMDARDFADFLGDLLADHEIPDPSETHSGIRIWGTLEARAMGAELLILAGLNEGSWPAAPDADPWLNRTLRAEAGLLLPDRQTGLSAHDFQQAAAGAEVWLTRATRSDDAETVPSRWLNRLTNMMSGLPEPGGPEALATMRARGARWLRLARAVETPLPAPRAARPSPVPPLSARPDTLSVTEIKTLIRDPYAIYARHVLRLTPLDPLMRVPDALLRGILVHEILERALKASDGPPDAAMLRAEAARVLGDPARLPSATERIRWQVRFDAIADWFADTEAARQATATPALTEAMGAAGLPGQGFTLRARLDRVDIDAEGHAHLYDYKTGAVPTGPQQQAFEKQLLLEAAMLEEGGFDSLGPVHVARAAFIGLAASNPKCVPAPLDDAPPAKVWAELGRLIAAYAQADKGYTARRAMLKDTDAGRYDHLARYGEWDVTDPARPEVL
jgi:double-strand break repair protein AddB